MRVCCGPRAFSAGWSVLWPAVTDPTATSDTHDHQPDPAALRGPERPPQPQTVTGAHFPPPLLHDMPKIIQTPLFTSQFRSCKRHPVLMLYYKARGKSLFSDGKPNVYSTPLKLLWPILISCTLLSSLLLLSFRVSVRCTSMLEAHRFGSLCLWLKSQ